jgi:hypothetical protein
MIIGGLILFAAILLPIVLFRRKRYWWTPIPICIAAYLALSAATYRVQRESAENEAADRAWEDAKKHRRPGTLPYRP